MRYGKILTVNPGSLAEELELVPGDKIIEVNNIKLRDIIDLSFAFADEEIDMLVEHEDGEQEMLSFDKDYDEELGVEFDSAVFDGIRNCANHCLFCFVDQVAPDMRETLSIKDDDYRLSFLYGNFVTMTNMGERDFKRIAQYHLSPLFISVQATNPKLRQRLLGCKNADKLMDNLSRLEQSDVEYHTQVVLCRDINDGDELDKTISDIYERRPYAQSLAIVPVGLTKFRSNCYELKPFDADSARRVIEQVEKWQERSRRENDSTFVYLGDEFYFLAGREVPPADYYDGFPQLDNGIGLARNFMEEFSDAQEDVMELPGYDKLIHLKVMTGTAIAPLFQRLADSLPVKNLKVTVIPVVNHHFGSSVNVSGLLTAKDMLRAMTESEEVSKADGILIPESALRTGENIFLDDVTLREFLAKLPVRAETVRSGTDLFQALSDWDSYQGVSGEHVNYTWQSNAAYTKQ